MVNTRFGWLILSLLPNFVLISGVLADDNGFCQPPANSVHQKTASQLNWIALSGDEDQFNQTQQLCGGYYRPFAPIALDAEPVIGNLYAAADRYTMTRFGEGELCGNVLLQQDDLQMSSDYVKINMATDNQQAQQEKSAEFFGEVRLLSAEAMVVGDHALADLSTDIIRLDHPQFLLTATQARGTAQQITHVGKTHTLIEKGSYTTCPPDNHDWLLKGRHFDLDHESGWGTVKQMRLEAGHVPIFYVPYFRFPIDDQRHTGFLYPEINNLSQPDIGMPFYWNIHPQVDLITTPRQIGGRGVMLENSLRYMANADGRTENTGKIFATYLPGDDLAENNNRSRLNWVHDSHFEHTLFAHVDLNSVSDNDYFDDFGTDLAANQTSYLNRQVSMSYLNASWSADLLVDSPEVIDNAIAASDEPYQKLPELTITQQSLLADQLNWFNSASYGYFSQPNALDVPYGQRIHLNSQLQLPLAPLWGYLTPSLRLQNTEYQLEPRNSSDARHLSRTLPTVSVDSGLFFERDLAKQRKHTLEPRIYYTYTPYDDQSALPNFDTTDLTFSWEQLFRDNRFSGVDRIGDTQQTTVALSSQVLDASLQTLARLTLGQIFYHQDQRVTLEDNAADNDNINDTSPRSPLVALAEWRMFDHLAAQTGVTWDGDNNVMDEGFAGLQFAPGAQQHWNLAYRYQQATQIDQVDLSVQYPLSLRWQLLARWNLDLQQQRTLEQISGLQYDSCCWQTTFAYHRWIKSSDLLTDASENDYAFLVQFYFKGLGQVGSKLNDLLTRGIPGYTSVADQP
jgi:LPS-assembly protein